MLLAAGTKGKRLALPRARVLIHQPYAQAGGQATDIELAAKEILRLRTDHIDGDLLLIEGVGPGYDPRERAAKLRAEAATG